MRWNGCLKRRRVGRWFRPLQLRRHCCGHQARHSPWRFAAVLQPAGGRALNGRHLPRHKGGSVPTSYHSPPNVGGAPIPASRNFVGRGIGGLP